jgi:hypothetical protein
VLLLAARGASAWWEAKHPLESDDRVDWKTPAEPRERAEGSRRSQGP